jgi:hypothetical protein
VAAPLWAEVERLEERPTKELGVHGERKCLVPRTEQMPDHAISRRDRFRSRQRDDGTRRITQDGPGDIVSRAHRGAKLGCTTLDEPKHRCRDVINTNVTKPVRRRATGRCLRRERADADAVSPETSPEQLAVESPRRLHIDRTEFVVREPVHTRPD